MTSHLRLFLVCLLGLTACARQSSNLKVFEPQTHVYLPASSPTYTATLTAGTHLHLIADLSAPNLHFDSWVLTNLTFDDRKTLIPHDEATFHAPDMVVTVMQDGPVVATARYATYQQLPVDAVRRKDATPVP